MLNISIKFLDYLVNGGRNVFYNEFDKTNYTESNHERSVDGPQQVTELTDPMISIYIKLQDSTRSSNLGNNNSNTASNSTGNSYSSTFYATYVYESLTIGECMYLFWVSELAKTFRHSF